MSNRMEQAIAFARSGGAVALTHFQNLAALEIESKGHQDFVTRADKEVEAHIRSLIDAAFPTDGIVGEEDREKPSQSGFTWVIDPIDGTANFVSGIPAWVVVLAIVKDDETIISVTFDANHDELFAAKKGEGATLNGRPLVCPPDTTITCGSVGTGLSNRTDIDTPMAVLKEILTRGGLFYRNASGALSLAYVASGRLIGYIEGHMNAWDCLAGQLLIAEAGGRIETQSANSMIARGGRVVAASAGVYDELLTIADGVFDGA